MKAAQRIMLALLLVFGIVLGLSVNAHGEPLTGSLEITKVVLPEDYETDQLFELHVYQVVGEEEFEVLEFGLHNGESTRLWGLEPGNYKIIETWPGGYYQAESDVVIETTVEAGQVSEVTLTNTCIYGGLIFEKEISSDGWYPYTEFTALYRLKGTTEWQSVPMVIGSERGVFVEPGIYEVKEGPIDVPGWHRLLGIDIEVKLGRDHTVTFRNAYTPTGTITVRKEVDPGSAPFDEHTEFEFKLQPWVEGSEPLDDGGEGGPGFPYEFTLENGQQMRFDLPPGPYEIYEKLPGDYWRCYEVHVTEGYYGEGEGTEGETPYEILDDGLVVERGNLGTGHWVVLTFKNIYDGPPEEPPATGLLTVRYIDSTTNEPLHNPTTHTGLVGSVLVVNAKTFEGYELVEGQEAVYEHEVLGSATYTFLYEPVGTQPEEPGEPEEPEEPEEPIEIPEGEPPLAPTGGMPLTAMYGAGVLLLGLGIALRKQRR